MAAAEYYFGSQGAINQTRPTQYAPAPQYQHQLQPQPPQNQHLQVYNAPPPQYRQNSYPLPPQQQPYHPQPQQNGFPSNGRPASAAPYPTTPPTGLQSYPGPPPHQNGYLGVPMQPVRSHSQPPRVHFANDRHNSDDSASDSDSDSDSSRRRRHRHRHSRAHSHSHHHDRDGSRDGDYDRDYDDDRERRHHPERKGHKDRDTFLGAGGGAIIGDAIFPGLGTAAGMLLGGYGGRKHAQRRSRSEVAANRESSGSWHSGRHNADSGWDADSATFKKGWAVR